MDGPEFLDRLNQVIANADKRTIANYAFWTFARHWTTELDERFQRARLDYVRRMTGKQEQSARWKQCDGAVQDRFKFAAGALYVRTHFQPQTKQVALEMIKDLLEEFKGLLAEADWMDVETRRYAFTKLQGMLPLVGFGDKALSDAKLDEYYRGVSCSITVRFSCNFRDFCVTLDVCKAFDTHLGLSICQVQF